MKENILKGTITLLLAGLSAYLEQLLIPLVVLLCVVVADYLTGMAKGWATSTLNSQRGTVGIVKKLGYFGMVVVGMVVDWLLLEGLQQAGVDASFSGFVALLVTVWLIINELLSILENLEALGVPAVPGLNRLLGHLKSRAERTLAEGDDQTNSDT